MTSHRPKRHVVLAQSICLAVAAALTAGSGLIGGDEASADASVVDAIKARGELRVAAPVAPPVIAIQPGDERLGVSLDQVIVNQDTSEGSGIRALAAVGPYKGDNAVRLVAEAKFCELTLKLEGGCSPVGATSAFARGTLVYEFCVPVRGSSVCGPDDGPPEEITVNVSFDHAFEGRLIAFDPLARASYAASARLRDMTANRTLDFRGLQDESVNGGVKLIKGVPIPIPGTTGVTTTERTTFQASVLRGHVIQFTAYAAVRAESALLGATSIFTSGRFPLLDGYFAIPDLDIQVSPEGSGGGGPTVPGLAELLAQLAERLNGLERSFSDRLTDLNAVLSEQLDSLNEVDLDLQTQIDALADLVETQQQQIVDLRDELAHHTHEYQAPKGRGDNSVPKTTGPAEFPSDSD